MTEDDLHGNRKYFWVNTEYGWTMKHLDQAGWWVDDMPSDEPQEGEEVVPVPAPARIEELGRENERLRKADDFAALVADSRAEAEKAMRKFPQPNYVISKIAEEAGEVVKAAIHCAEGRETTENLRGEMKQVIAMLYRLWVEGDGVHGLPPARTPTQGETP